MTTAPQRELELIADELLMLVRESADFNASEEVRSALSEAGRAIASIRRRLDPRPNGYVVAVVGLSNVGKSTLLNALLGAELAPRRNGPCTAAPIEFTRGDRLRVTAHHRRRVQRLTWLCSSVDEVHERLASLADDAGDSASLSIRKVVVESPADLLRDGLVIADTPGFGAAQAAQAAGSHEHSLIQYLRNEVSQVFWVVLAEQGIGKREKAFHDAHFGDVCDDIVVTGCDDWEAHDKARFRRRFAGEFQARMPRFHFVSGLRGIRAREASSAAGLAEAGITLLEDRIRELARPAGRVSDIQDAIIQLAADLGAWLAERPHAQPHSPQPLWRPDSWSRWSACAPKSDVKRRVTRQLEAVR